MLKNTIASLAPTLLALCLSPLAFGCNNAGTDLEDTARNISRRSSQMLQQSGHTEDEDEDEADDESTETDVSAATDQGMAGAPAPAPAAEDDDAGDESGEPAEDAPASEPPMVPSGPTSDDSVRCGDGVLDSDELCDIRIPHGEKGACPEASDCEPLDACHAPKLDVHGCWTQCVLGEPVAC